MSPLRMTTVTGGAGILVIIHLRMFIVHIGLVMLMAVDTFEVGEIGRVDMAIGAVIPLSGMCPGIDRKVQAVMIPGGPAPVRSGMAGLAIGREIRRGMIGVGGGVIIILMAGDTGGWRAGIAGAVTIDAGDGQMSPGKRKPGGVMVVGGRLPGNGRVTDHTGLRKTTLNVIRVRRRHIIIAVTVIAIGRSPGECCIMTDHAFQKSVGAGQRKSRRMSISGVIPGAAGGAVTRFAIHRKTGPGMARIGGSGKQ